MARKPAPRTATRATPATSQAARHSRTRAAHAAETAEDYAEIIADLSDRGEARVTAVAACLGVSHVTVVRTIARLAREGYVVARPYRSLSLTPKGVELAERSRRRHDIVLRFLLALGVPERTAQEDAEGIEHHVSAGTLAAMERFAARNR